jgi:hypothetical protein
VPTTNKLSGFTDEEIALYTSERYKIYRGTIAVCIIYAAIALILILIGYFTEWGREFILGTILPFIATYIIGTIIVIIILAYSVSEYKPRKIDNRPTFDNAMCPDYWKLLESDKKEYKDDEGNVYLSSNVNPHLFKYKCVMDNSVLNNSNIYRTSDIGYYKFSKNSHLVKDLGNFDPAILKPFGLNGTDNQSNFYKYSLHMSGFDINNDLVKNTVNAIETPHSILPPTGVTLTAPLVCDKVYPLYLSAMDQQNASLNPNEPNNRFRCAYASACGVPWAEAGCD